MMDYRSNSSSLTQPDITMVWLPSKSELEDIKVPVWDVELYNLKRAYGLQLEPQEDGVEELEKRSVVEREEDPLEGQDPLEFCEITEEEDISSQSDGGQYKCCYCFFEGTIVQLRNHTKYCHPGENVRTNWCGRCRVNFENESVLKRHEEQEHHFSCSECNKNFSMQKHLRAHMSSHGEKEIYKCPTCEKTFPVHRYLVRHLERHEKGPQENETLLLEKPIVYSCTVCQKTFTKKESLVKHTRIHSRESLKCSICEFTCGKKVTLKMHFLTHEGYRKYKCDHCDFSFKQIGHLKRHILRFNH